MRLFFKDLKDQQAFLFLIILIRLMRRMANPLPIVIEIKRPSMETSMLE
jgi:hypothetical protein